VKVAHREDVHAVTQKTINHCVARNQTLEQIVIEGIALIDQLLVDLWKRALNVAKRGLDRSEIEHWQSASLQSLMIYLI
jgi:hypothetical protein